MGEKHTPGPWRLNAGNEIEIMGSNRAIGRALCGGMSGIRLAEAEANARIMASALDMLASLLFIRAHLAPHAGHVTVLGDLYKVADAAIVIATPTDTKPAGEA